MSRLNTIEIGGHKIELFFSTWAMLKLGEMVGGDISELGEWLQGCESGQLMERLSKILSLLANAAVMKRNADIDLGLEQGEKKPMFPEEYFIYTANTADIMEYKNEIFSTIGMGMNYVVPEGVEIETKDPDLAELEREKDQ